MSSSSAQPHHWWIVITARGPVARHFRTADISHGPPVFSSMLSRGDNRIRIIHSGVHCTQGGNSRP